MSNLFFLNVQIKDPAEQNFALSRRLTSEGQNLNELNMLLLCRFFVEMNLATAAPVESKLNV